MSVRRIPVSPLARIRLGALCALSVGLLAFTGCASSAGTGATPSAPSSSSSSGPTPTPTATAVVTASPRPTETSGSDLPYNGEVLIVTAEREGGNVAVTAMVPNIAEDGGTCTLSIEGVSATASVEGIAGNGVTYCGVMTVAVPADGAVTFRVVYTSSTTRAQSAPSTVESGQ